VSTPNDRCSAPWTHYPDLRCSNTATFYVHKFGRPSQGRYACTQHLGKVCRAVATDQDTVQVVVMSPATADRSEGAR
jgi:hypothetical protein